MTTQEKVVGMVYEGRGVGGKLPGFFKRVSEFLSLQQERWKGRLVEVKDQCYMPDSGLSTDQHSFVTSSS